MSRDVVHDGAGSLKVRFPFDRRLVDLVKSLSRRRWLAEERVWSIPDADVVLVVDLLQPEGFRFDDEVRRRYRSDGGARTLFDGAAAGEDWTVGRLNREVRAALESAFPGSLWLTGEICGFNRAAHKRHVGFSLIERDAAGEQASQVSAILFENTRREIERKLAAAGDPFRLEDEVQVRVRARVDLYEPWGTYRVEIEDLDVAHTLGEAARRREAIVRRLGAEGLLERNAALPLARVPLSVGLITSLGSDAFHDVIRTLRESGFAFAVTVHGARVQGRATEGTVRNALDWFRARARHFDVILVCRGGGSRTDLAWFDSEPLGRAVALFPIPVVVGIGHEQDVSVLDHVARRAKTPTAAARLLVDLAAEAARKVEADGASILEMARDLLDETGRRRRETAQRVARGVARRIESSRASLMAAARLLGQGARRDLAAEARRMTETARGLRPRALRATALAAERVSQRERRVHLVHPRRVIERGYAIVRGSSGRVVTGPRGAPAGARVTAELRDGTVALISEGGER